MEKQLASDSTLEKYMVPGLERGLRLLGEFNHQERLLSAPELARRLDVPRSTVFRLLATLEHMGFVERASDGRNFRLGMAVLRLGFEYLASLELTALGQPILDRLRDDTGYSCNLVVRDARSIVYVAKSMSYTPFSSSVTVGTRLPVHGTVLGLVLLLDHSLAELRALYPEEHLENYSQQTPDTTMALFNLIKQGQQDGYVLRESFFEPNISTVAAPVRDHSGVVVAALGLTVPASKIAAAEHERMTQQTCLAAEQLSQLLGYTAVAADRKVIPLRAG